jgi:hypothetical protein
MGVAMNAALCARAARFPRVVVLALAALVLVPALAAADFWPKGDWKNQKHKLTVCLKSTTKCPAGMEDSLKAAIALWNAKGLTWIFVFTTDCDAADIKVSCKNNMRSLGTTFWDYTSGENTSADVHIKGNADWGWCDDKLELVSTIAHELGHCCRLKDTAAGDQSKCMRGAQAKAGHSRGPSEADSKEAAASDTAAVETAVTQPKNAQKQGPYGGVITPAPGTWPFELHRALGVQLLSFQPEFLQILNTFPMGPEQLGWQGMLTSPTPHMLVFHLLIAYPESTSVREGILYATELGWQPSWVPFAVAPNDTTVPFNSSDVILDTRRSMHPGGDVMAFGWRHVADNGFVLQSQGPEVAVNLPVGTHKIELTAFDQAGNTSTDQMQVTVLANTGVDDNRSELQLAFRVPVPRGEPMVIHYAVPATAPVTLRVYDIQGRLVQSLAEGRLEPAGAHLVTWDLRDRSGNQVEAGAYFCALQVGEARVMRRMVILP